MSDSSRSGDIRLLVVDDDVLLSTTIRHFFERLDYVVDWACSNAGFRDCLRGGCIYDVVLLDLNLPDSDGLDILADFRKTYNTLLYIVSGRRDTESRVRALELGADDFVQKPFSVRELELKVRNAIARYLREPSDGISENKDHIESVSWSLDRRTRTARLPNGNELPLTNGELKLLEAFLKSGGRMMSREQLLSYLPPSANISSAESITTLVYRLRQKFRSQGIDPQIATVAGEGYRLTGHSRR